MYVLLIWCENSQIQNTEVILSNFVKQQIMICLKMYLIMLIIVYIDFCHRSVMLSSFITFAKHCMIVNFLINVTV
jgi:hypothetical protein